MKNGTGIEGGLKFQTCCVLTHSCLNLNVSLVLQAVFLQLTLKSECGLSFLVEVLESRSQARLIGVQTKPSAWNTPAMTRIIYFVSPASNFSWIPQVNQCLVTANQDVGICFFPIWYCLGKCFRLAQRMWTSVTDELGAELCILGEAVFTHISIL